MGKKGTALFCCILAAAVAGIPGADSLAAESFRVNDISSADGSCIQQVSGQNYQEYYEITQEEMEKSVSFGSVESLRFEFVTIHDLNLAKAKKLKTVVLENAAVKRAENFFNAGKLENITIGQGSTTESTLDFSKASKLKSLRLLAKDIKGVKVSGRQLRDITAKDIKAKKLNLAKCTKLKKVTIQNTGIKSLDLTKNKNLTEVAVQNGEECRLTDLKTGKTHEDTFFKSPEQGCKVRFAGKNKIKKLEYYTSDKLIDLTKLTSLKELHIAKGTAVKVSAAWYQNNKKKVKVYCEGFLQKKLKQTKSKNSVILKPTKVSDGSYGYDMLSDGEDS